MTDEEIDRFAVVLRECERIRAKMARDEAALSDGEHDGIPIAAAPPDQRPALLTRATTARPGTAWGLLTHSTRAMHCRGAWNMHFTQ